MLLKVMNIKKIERIFFIFKLYTDFLFDVILAASNKEFSRTEMEIIMDSFVSIMEMMMVVCFGISWPINIIKAWKSQSSKGISLLFYFFIWIGYVFALIGKFVLIYNNAPLPWYETVHWYVMFFYLLNILMVTAGILIYFRNKRYDSEQIRNTQIIGGVSNEAL